MSISWERIERLVLLLSLIGGIITVIQFSGKDAFPIIKDIQINECKIAPDGTRSEPKKLVLELLKHEMEIVYLSNILIEQNPEQDCPVGEVLVLPVTSDAETLKVYDKEFGGVRLFLPSINTEKYFDVLTAEGTYYKPRGPVRIETSWDEGILVIQLSHVDVEKGLYSHYACAKKKAEASGFMNFFACF